MTQKAESVRSMQQQLQTWINGYQSTCVLVAAFRLGIFDELSQHRRSIEDLSNALRAHIGALTRFMRVLELYGLVALYEGGQVALTETGFMLCSGGRLSHRLHMVASEYLAVWSRLDLALISGKAVFEATFGQGPWEHRTSNSDIGDAFDRMTESSGIASADRLVGAYGFSSFERVADVGGGKGYLLSRLMARYPKVSTVLFDRPNVVAAARTWLEERGYTDRCQLMAGSFFEEVPANCGLYILQYVLHNWDDENCTKILKCCAARMAGKARLLILEKPIKLVGGTENGRGLSLLDMHMLLVHGGRERTIEAYDGLLASAALRRVSHRGMDADTPDIIEVVAM